MEFEDEFDSDNLLFNERVCRSCNKKKDLITNFYLIRKNKKGFPSAYSYECKDCTIKRVVASRMVSRVLDKWEYPDW